MSEDAYLATLEKTREAALAAVKELPLSGQLHAVATFHDTAQEMARNQFGGRDTAISDYHGILAHAAREAAIRFTGMH